MEFSPEIAVLQSSLQLAYTEKSKEDEKPCSKFIKIVASAVHEVIDGLESERSDLDKQFWRFKVFSLLLNKVLYSEEQIQICTSADGPANSVNQICQQLPPLQLTSFLEIVKKLDWFELLSQGLCVLDPVTSQQLVSRVIHHATEYPVDRNDALLISATLDCVISRWISSMMDGSIVTETTGNIASWLNNIFLFLTNVLGKEFRKTDDDISFLLHIFTQLTLCGVLSDLTDDSRGKVNKLMNSALQTREITGNKQSGSFSQCCTWFKTHTLNSTQISVMSLPIDFPFCEWMKTFSTLCVILKENCPELDQCLKDFEDRVLIVLDHMFTFSLEPLVSCFSQLIENEQYIVLLKQADVPNLVQTCNMMAEISQQLLASLSEMKEKRQREEREHYSTFSLEDILKHRLPGCEELLMNILSDFDLTWWSKNSVCKDLLENIDLFCDVDHIKQLKLIVQRGREVHPENTTALNNVRKVLLTAFSRLPMIVQEQLIVEQYLNESDPTFLSSVGAFHKDITIIFNKFTSDSDDKLLFAVLGLALQDPLHVILKSVETAVRNSGQIPVVLKILQTLPDLCRCFHSEFHRDESLLSHVVHSSLMSGCLQDKEKTNIINLILLAVQNFETKVCGRFLQEAPVLHSSEFISKTVLPYIGVETMFESDQPISVEFSLRLLTSVIEEVGGDGTSSLAAILNPCPLMLCLCALLHECIVLSDDPDRFVTKATIRRLCTQCWLSVEKMLRIKSSSFTDLEVNWLLSEVKYLDWTVLLRLQMTLCVLQGKNEEDGFLDNVASHLTSDYNYVSLFRFVSLSDENLKAVGLPDPVVVEEIILSLLQVLPNVTADEAKRVCVYVKCLLSTSHSHFPFRLFFQDTIDLYDFQGMKGALHLSQVLMEVFVLTVQSPHLFPSVVLRHMAACYVAVMKNITKENFLNEDHLTVTFTLSQMFCHVSIITSLMTSDLSQALFVLLLDILSKYVEHTDRFGSDELKLDEQSMWEPLCQAVQMIEHEDIRNNLMNKLKERYTSAGY
ncbi:uncharacterized protein LOC121383227 [Gigantopelta aegis]|uniref:uncharacterized protein LOC121383227 n=1 Tax=Gigantopelta aegis TaxID=1735272 RepID=UPI001B88B978|nr:uncharacterized protein LOC121383227 [Gigantopelta aegis]